jgi:hypothetical protein
MFMFKRYYADMVTEAAVPPAQAFRFFCNVQDWADWSSVIASARLLNGDWRRGALLMFAPKLPGLPAAPLIVPILEFEPDHRITWGVNLPMARMLHRFTFTPVEGGSCRIHHEEWSEGVISLLTLPVTRRLRAFNERFARELAAMF